MNKVIDKTEERDDRILNIANKVHARVEEGKKRDKRHYSFVGC